MTTNRTPTEIRVFLDDVRDAPLGWVRVYTAGEAISLLEEARLYPECRVVELSLDHDLGDEATCGTGHHVLAWLEEQVALHGFEPPPMIKIHSANVVGRARMEQAIASIERLLVQRGRAPEMKPPKVVRIVSGGQTGADRGGLDAAIALGIAHGGWCPRGRKAEDGTIPERYTLMDVAASDYSVRTRRNVEDSDGTVVFTRGYPSGGSALTIQHARKIGKPVQHVDLGAKDPESAAMLVRAWLVEHEIEVLNVAGSRESKAPGLGDDVRQVLVRALIGQAPAKRGPR